MVSWLGATTETRRQLTVSEQLMLKVDEIDGDDNVKAMSKALVGQNNQILDRSGSATVIIQSRSLLLCRSSCRELVFDASAQSLAF